MIHLIKSLINILIKPLRILPFMVIKKNKIKKEKKTSFYRKKSWRRSCTFMEWLFQWNSNVSWIFFFQRHFRMNKSLFMHIVDRLSNEVDFFRQKKDGLGRLGLLALQKCTSSIHVLAYGSGADMVDEYLWLGETKTRSCLENFVEGIIYLFGDEYLRRPTPADLQRLLDIGEHRRFLGMIGNINCMHWEWKNCLTAWKDQYSRGSAKPTIVL